MGRRSHEVIILINQTIKMLSLAEIESKVVKIGKNRAGRTALNELSSIPPERINKLKRLTSKDICEHLRTARGVGKRKRRLTEASSQEKSISWRKNECLVFEWLTVCHCHNQHTTIQSMGPQGLQLLTSCFPEKDIVFLNYELERIRQKPSILRSCWEDTDKELLQKVLATKEAPYVWSDVAIDLYRISEGSCFKSPASCRQLWNSYLIPGIKKEKWTPLEDYMLLLSVKRYGKRWALISRHVEGGRSEHTVKNRFKALSKKLIPTHRSCPEGEVVTVLIQRVKEDLGPHDRSLAEMHEHERFERSHSEGNIEEKQEESHSEQKFPPGEAILDSYEERYLDIDAMLNERFEREERKEVALEYVGSEGACSSSSVSLFQEFHSDSALDLMKFGAFHG